MALVGKSGRDRDFRQRKVGLTKHALRSIQPPGQKVAVRRHSHRLVECPCEMMSGDPAIAASASSPIFWSRWDSMYSQMRWVSTRGFPFTSSTIRILAPTLDSVIIALTPDGGNQPVLASTSLSEEARIQKGLSVPSVYQQDGVNG